MLAKFRSLLKDESGATAIEYSILIAIVAVILVSFIEPIQTSVNTIFTQVSTALSSASAK